MSSTIDCQSMLSDGKLFGQLVRHRSNMQVFWSGQHWSSPLDALNTFPGDWLALGTEGWWRDENQKELFNSMKGSVGDLFPVWPGEWCDLDDPAAVARAALAERDEAQPEMKP